MEHGKPAVLEKK